MRCTLNDLITKVVEINNARDVIFNIFSQVFSDVPNFEFDNFLSNTAEILIKIASESDNKHLKDGVNLFNCLFENSYVIDRISLEKRQKDYTRLFMLGQNIVPIYESIYTSPEKSMMQESWFRVKTKYHENYFRKDKDIKTAEDHISLELQFMGLLSKRVSECFSVEDFNEAETVLTKQIDFYENHINKWIPIFCEQIIKLQPKLSTDFYPAFSYLLLGFIAEDYKLIKDLCGK